MLDATTWAQFCFNAGASAVVGLVVLLVLRFTLRGARDTINTELRKNGGKSLKDTVEATHDAVIATRQDMTLLALRFDEHLKYLHPVNERTGH
jgi:uncharacterized membrane protein